MEGKYLQLLEKYSKDDPELQSLWEEHILFEKKVEKLESKPYLTPSEENELKELKKQKLDGKTKLQVKLEYYAKQ